MKKITTILLVTSLMLSTFSLTGCKEKENADESNVISADSVWYTTEKINISKEAIASTNNYQKVIFRYLGMVGDDYCCSMNADLLYQASENLDAEDKYINNLLIVGKDGKIKNEINLYDYIEADTSDYSEYFDNLFFENNTIKGYISHYDKNTYETNYSYIDINPVDGSATDRTSYESSNGSGYVEGIYQVSGQTIISHQIVNAAGKISISLNIEDSDNNIETIDTKDFFPNEDIWDIEKIEEYGKDEALIFAQNSEHEMCILLNLNSMTMEDLCPDGLDWMERITLSDITAQDGHFYAIDNGLIKEYDFKNQTVSTVFDFVSCNINQFDIKDCKLEKYSDDEIFLSCMTNEGTTMFSGITDEFYLYKLTKNDVNPNADKVILKVGFITGLSRPVAEAVSVFNDTNEEYYIQIDSSYNVNNLINMPKDDMRYESSYKKAVSELSDRMAIDLISGNGPDIIVDGLGIGQINNENCFIDLSDYISTLDSLLFYKNIFDGVRVDGKLFQMPLAFKLQCIVTGESNSPSGKDGFTFDEYNQFVHEKCNGIDPIQLERKAYFSTMLNSMDDLFIDEGKYNYDNDAFKNAASYAKDNVSSFPQNMDDGINSFEAYFDLIGGFGLYMSNHEDWQSDHKIENIRLLGLPSSDERGPTAYVCNSIGISAQSANPDACWEFVKILLGEEVQNKMARGFSFPVNPMAYNTISREMVNRYNYYVENNIVLSWRPIEGEKFDISIADDLEDTIRNAHVSNSNSTIDAIIQEEIQPYFAGQKTLEQIIPVLGNRVNTVEDERK